MKHTKSGVVAAALLALSGAVQAALIDRGGGLIYDTTRDLTWLADMNYAFTSGYATANAGGSDSRRIDASGSMGWDAAVEWADALVYAGFSDWRLPTIDPADATCSYPGGMGINCSGGELTGLFFTEFGFNADASSRIESDDTAEQIANRALFKNLQPYYWTGTLFDSDNAYGYEPYFGTVYFLPTIADFSVLAVRTGDVAAVPEPQTLALVLLALGTTAVVRRKRPT
jgi:hypothetical protein